MWAMMEKFRICAGAVKVWSARLLMGISWYRSGWSLRRAGLRVSPAYRGRAVSTQSRAPAVPYARKHGSAVEDVSTAYRRCRESDVQRGTQAHPHYPEV